MAALYISCERGLWVPVGAMRSTGVLSVVSRARGAMCCTVGQGDAATG